METRSRDAKSSLLDPAILVPAIGQAFAKLDPRLMIRNPVMFVVELGSVLTTLIAIRDLDGFAALVAVWLWFTVLFANFAEAVAEGRGKAQADTLRRGKKETVARRLTEDGEEHRVPGTELAIGDLVVV